MSESGGKHAFGSYVEYSTDGAAWTNPHLEVAMVNQPARKRAAAKATHLESPDQHKETRPGIKEVMPFKVTLNYTGPQYDTLSTYYEAATSLYWRVSHPLEQGQTTPDRIVGYGWISQLGEVKLDPEDTTIEVFDLEVTTRSGKWTFTKGS